MPRILVVFGTNTGHTARIAQAIGETLRARRFDVDVVAAGATVRAEDYAGVVVAASVRAGRYQRAVRRWARDNARGMLRQPTAFVSVCLAVRDPRPTARRELEAVMNRFFDETRWRPMVTKMVAGALLYTKYNWLVRQMMKRIVKKAGGDTDTSRDYEYTDWADVRQFAEQFSDRVQRFAARRNSLVA
jgi:menaquinone-dependent protoporphyrinogen oxidase